MKAKVFIGVWYDAQSKFNEWAQGKALGRDVIIHTVFVGFPKACDEPHIAIVVYHPEGAVWDSTKSKPIQRVQPKANESTGLEHKDERILLAPIHEEPEPHIKVEEMQVSA